MSPSTTTRLESTPRVEAALDALAQGLPVLLYDADGREEETDLVFASEHADAHAVRHLRTQAGGLLCTTLSPAAHAALGLPWLSDVLKAAADQGVFEAGLLDGEVPYEDGALKPSFSLTVNHRDTYTGVTDRDRSRTIRAVADLARRALVEPDAVRTEFTAAFRTPGHVILLNAHPRMLDARRGHTELATALVEMAGLAPSATICEMVGGPDGSALPKADAVKYAASHGHVFLTGQEVLDAWRQRNTRPGRNGRASA